MTKEEKREIIDKIIRIFMEDDDFDICMKEQIKSMHRIKYKLKL